MLVVMPDYFKEFKCIAGKCNHNCCIGWEIDIDCKMAEYYRAVKGNIGERLKRCISAGDEPHFILDKEERCPFLNSENLCDLIINLGENALCEICSEHPRFNNELPGRVEKGLGLCCEAAARLIIGKQEKVGIEYSEDYKCDDDIIILRDNIIETLQNRERDIFERISEMLRLCRINYQRLDIERWTDRLLSLERLDDAWTDVLNNLKDTYKNIDYNGFESFIKSRKVEYEQMAVYFIYRHFANAPDMEEASCRAVFAALATEFIYNIGAALWSKNGDFTFEQQIETVRAFSSEIEYSDENLYGVLDFIYNDMC